MPEEPTIESLQKELVDLRATMTEKDAKLEALQKQNNDNTKSLEEARKLNTRLLLNNPSATPTNETEEPKEDTIDDIVNDVVNTINESYLKRFKQ